MHWALRFFLAVMIVFWTALVGFNLALLAMMRHGIEVKNYVINPLLAVFVDGLFAAFWLTILTAQPTATASAPTLPDTKEE